MSKMHRREARAIAIALGAYTLLCIVQLIAYFSTHTLVLLGEAFETLCDVIISLLFLLVLFWSSRPADEGHMFGHERAQNVAAVVAATILFGLMSVEMFRQAITRLGHHGRPETHNPALGIAITVAGMVFVVIAALIMLRVEKPGAAARAQLVGLGKDICMYVVAIIGISLVAAGYLWADAVSSMVLAAFIAASGIYLLADNFHMLVGKAPDRAFILRLTKVVRAVPGVLHVHDIRAEYVGRENVYVALHINVKSGTPIEEADRIAEEVRRKIKAEMDAEYSEVHVDPAGLLT